MQQQVLQGELVDSETVVLQDAAAIARQWLWGMKITVPVLQERVLRKLQVRSRSALLKDESVPLDDGAFDSEVTSISYLDIWATRCAVRQSRKLNS